MNRLEDRPRLVCVLCGLIVMQYHIIEDDGYDYWEDRDFPSRCPANAGGDHLDPDRMTGVQIEAVLEIRRRWLNP